MKKGRSLVTGLFFLVASCICAASDPNSFSKLSVSDPCLPQPSIQRWMVWNFWQGLQPGMNKEKVLEILGEPLEKESTETACVWYYQQAPRRLESGVIQRPRFGFLNFKIMLSGGQEVMLLKTWKEPNWNEASAYTPDQFQVEQQRLEQLRQEELQRQELLEKQRQLEEERKQQQEAIKQQQIQQERQIRAQQAAEREKKFSLDNIPQVYWYAAGGVLIGLAVAVIFIKKPFMD